MESMGDIFAYSGRFFSGLEIRSLSCFSQFCAEFLKICFMHIFIYTVSNEMGGPLLWRTWLPDEKTDMEREREP